MKTLFLLLFSTILITINAQEKSFIDFEIIVDDTIFFSELPEIEILEFKNKMEMNEYYNLRRRVFKVYPYALAAKSKIEEIKLSLDSINNKRKKRRYIKKMSGLVRAKYTESLKKLTMNDGKVLVKLIYRETKSTSYDIVKSYRGGVNAFFWQILAKFWDNNLKTDYDPANVREDMLIENILIQAKLKSEFE